MKNILEKDLKHGKWTIVVALLSVLLVVVFLIVFFMLHNTPEIIANNDNLLLEKPHINSTEQIKELFYKQGEIKQVSTRYSILYGNSKNREMYVFSNPVRESQEFSYSVINREIENSGDYYCVTNDSFCVYFLKDKITAKNGKDCISITMNSISDFNFLPDYLNVYGEKTTAIKYNTDENNYIVVYPSCYGINLEYSWENPINDVALTIGAQDYDYEKYEAGYVMLLDQDDKKVIFHKAALYDENKNFLGQTDVGVSNSSDSIEVKYNISPNKSSSRLILISIDFYFEKMFFDTSVYEAIPKTNTVFNNISLFDSFNPNNEGYTYMKFNIASFTPKNSDLLKSAVLNFYVMGIDAEAIVDVYVVENDWCSWLHTWSNKEEFYKQIGYFTVSKIGWHSIDMTDYVKDLIDNQYYGQENNSIVFKLRDNCNSVLVLASTDNTYAPPFWCIKYVAY